jgi:hypothetical protein
MCNVQSSPSVVDCTFESNGVQDCIFTDSGGGCSGQGGGMLNLAGNPSVTRCVFTDNYAGAQGGGMFNESSNPTVLHCRFDGNSAGWCGRGGAMYNLDSSPTLVNCTVIGNIAYNCCYQDDYGDGDGEICYAGEGGAMVNVGSSPTLINCVVAGNTAAPGDFGSLAGGMSSGSGGSPTLLNCIVRSNDSGQISDSNGTSTILSYTNIQGGWSGRGNIDIDPLFVDPDSGDFRLSSDSPCIDAGHNNAIADLADSDLDGDPRFADDPATADTGCGVPVVVDMGAYEFQGEPAVVVFADLTGDGIVDLDDFDILLDCWSSSDEACCLADLDLDGTVGIVDFLNLLGNWG